MFFLPFCFCWCVRRERLEAKIQAAKEGFVKLKIGRVRRTLLLLFLLFTWRSRADELLSDFSSEASSEDPPSVWVGLLCSAVSTPE